MAADLGAEVGLFWRVKRRPPGLEFVGMVNVATLSRAEQRLLEFTFIEDCGLRLEMVDRRGTIFDPGLRTTTERRFRLCRFSFGLGCALARRVRVWLFMLK